MKSFLTLALFLLSSAVVSPQSNVPRELDIYHDSIRDDSTYLTHFCPLGFSEHGSCFSYVLYRNVSGGIGYFTYFEMNIPNMVTDEIESQLIYDGRYRIDSTQGSYPELYKNDPEYGF
jgi:hypothetical protein